MNRNEDVAHTYSGILLCHEEWGLTICDNGDGPIGYYVKSVSQRKKNTKWFPLYVKSKKKNKWTNRPGTLIDTENTLMVVRWEGVGELGKKGDGIKTYKIGSYKIDTRM